MRDDVRDDVTDDVTDDVRDDANTNRHSYSAWSSWGLLRRMMMNSVFIKTLKQRGTAI